MGRILLIKIGTNILIYSTPPQAGE
jgi:hypothetical protein